MGSLNSTLSLSSLTHKSHFPPHFTLSRFSQNPNPKMTNHPQPIPDPNSEPKKKRRVAISPVDNGIVPNDCFEIYLVSSKEEAEAGIGHRVTPVDLNHFFGDEEKIFGYQGLKIVALVSSVSFHVYVDIKYESSSDRGKGVTDLKAALQDIFAENIVEKKDVFLQTFLTESQYISSVVAHGEVLSQNSSNGQRGVGNGHSTGPGWKIVRLAMGDTPAGDLYSRLVPLVLLLVDGSNPIDVTDSGWEMYVIVQEMIDGQGGHLCKLFGFAVAYRFYHYPGSSRLRLGQILVLPSYQNKGYGRQLVELLCNVAVSENVHDLTVEEPVESLQRIRYIVDIPRLLTRSSVKQAVESAALHLKEANLSKRTQILPMSPPQTAVDDVRESLKINKKQFTQCWDILVYLALDPVDKYMENFQIFVTDRVKASVFGKGSETKEKRVVDTTTELGESFVMCKSQEGEETKVEVDDDKKIQEQQLQELVEERLTVIELVAQKVSSGRV